MTGPAFGPQEPDWVRRCRDLYYEPMIRLRALEGRISATDSGMHWLYKVKGHNR